jgi:hypothetical protein
LSALRQLVAAMRAAGAIADSPSDDEVVTWVSDAVRLQHTGTLNGTAIGPDKAPVAGVTVACMEERTESDARGRFRLRRLPLGRSLLVRLEHDDYKTKAQPRKAAPPGVMRGEQFRLARKPAHAPPERALSELQGDRLPALGSAPIRTRAQTSAPREDDLLCITEFLDGGDARVVSRLFDYDGGVFVVRSYRLKRSELPTGAKLRDHLRFRAGRWEAVEITATDVERYRRRLREQQLRKLPDNPTADDVDRTIEAWQAARARDRAR